LATKKVVQTELGEREYDLLSDVAKKEGLTIKEAARRALLEWSISVMELKDDPLFKLRPVRFKKRIKSSEIDRFLLPCKVARERYLSTHPPGRPCTTRKMI